MARSFLSQLLTGTLRVVADQLSSKNRRTRGGGGRTGGARRPSASFKSPPGSRLPPAPAPVPAGHDPKSTGAPLDQPAREYRMPPGGLPPIVYAPVADSEPDPGEVVWAWVPYEEDATQGKDRPVLIVARVRGGYLGCQMTSQDHDRDAVKEASYGRFWVDVGSGPWDRQRRESEVRIDRLLFMTAGAVRREGANLPRERFEDVAAALTRFHAR